MRPKQLYLQKEGTTRDYQFFLACSQDYSNGWLCYLKGQMEQVVRTGLQMLEISMHLILICTGSSQLVITIESN